MLDLNWLNLIKSWISTEHVSQRLNWKNLWGVQYEECQECEDCDLGLVVQKRLRKKQKSCTSVPRAVWAGRSCRKDLLPISSFEKAELSACMCKVKKCQENVDIVLELCMTVSQNICWSCRLHVISARLLGHFWPGLCGGKEKKESKEPHWLNPWTIINTVPLAGHNFCIFFQAEVKIVKTPQAMDLSFEMFSGHECWHLQKVFTSSNEAGPVQVILPNHRLQYTKDEEGKYSAFISELYHFVPSVCDLLSSVILRLILSCLDVFWQLICSAQGHGTDLRTAGCAGHGLYCGGSHASVSAWTTKTCKFESKLQ